MFEYDSDWSDLADDEDPDSNDERFAGNDYPEEEGKEKMNYNWNENENEILKKNYLILSWRIYLILFNIIT